MGAPFAYNLQTIRLGGGDNQQVTDASHGYGSHFQNAKVQIFFQMDTKLRKIFLYHTRLCVIHGEGTGPLWGPLLPDGCPLVVRLLSD